MNSRTALYFHAIIPAAAIMAAPNVHRGIKIDGIADVVSSRVGDGGGS